MNIIEPCCAERQLGSLLRENRGHAALFQTNGDMTLQKWMKATMLMVGDRPRTLTLAVPVFTEKMMKAVAKYLRLGWVEHLRLMTTEPLTQEMAQHFVALVYPGDGEAGAAAEPQPTEGKCATDSSLFTLYSSLTLAADASAPDGLLMFTGPKGTVVVQGPMFDTITPRLCLYAGLLGRTERLAVRSITDAWEARFRARRYEADPTPATATPASPSATVPKVSASGETKKSRTRKTKKDEKPTEEMA